jgi:hypothetical protein
LAGTFPEPGRNTYRPQERTETVLPPLDIFKMQEGTYVWKAAAETFELAKSKVQQLAAIAPGDYMIFSQTTGKKTVIPLDAT